jgi:serine/threonine protein kinase
MVYAARGADGKSAAIKLFFQESLGRHGIDEAKERLELQLGLVGAKRHPNLVEIYDGGAPPQSDRFFLVMEFVPGTSLDNLLGRIPRESVPVLLGQLAAAARYLEEEHELFHRDIKPANIVVSDDFRTLTLLDLGIAHRICEDAADRLSGTEFVATLRYSPPEFVWRTEEGNENGAWRAITFYQMGATLYDMLTGRRLFEGEDQPRAKLYDSVRYRTPEIVGEGLEPWLVQLAQACLLKDWRGRLRFVNWDSFKGAPEVGLTARERSIELRQARQNEIRLVSERNLSPVDQASREQDLWRLNAGLFGELRTYLLDSSIFPKFKVVETSESERRYHSLFLFEIDANKGFTSPWALSVCVMASTDAGEATEIQLVVTHGDASIPEEQREAVLKAQWTEMFNVESAFANCRGALLGAIDLLLPK